MKDSKPIGGIGPGAGPGVRERVARRAEKNALLGRMYNVGAENMKVLLRKEKARG